MAFAPLIGLALSAGGAAASGVAQSDASAYNASIYANEGKTAGAQGYEAEAQQRRNTAEVISSETAAAGQAGGGYGGSTGRRIGQSAVNAELDAMNIRYKSQLQRWSYDTQSANLRSEARTAGNAGFLKAGGALLKGYSNNYTGAGLTDLG